MGRLVHLSYKTSSTARGTFDGLADLQPPAKRNLMTGSSVSTGRSRDRGAILAELFDGLPTESDALVRELRAIREEVQGKLAAALTPAVNMRIREGSQTRFVSRKRSAAWVDHATSSLGLCPVFPGTRQPAIIMAERHEGGVRTVLLADLGQSEYARFVVPADARVELITAPIQFGELEIFRPQSRTHVR